MLCIYFTSLNQMNFWPESYNFLKGQKRVHLRENDSWLSLNASSSHFLHLWIYQHAKIRIGMILMPIIMCENQQNAWISVLSVHMYILSDVCLAYSKCVSSWVLQLVINRLIHCLVDKNTQASSLSILQVSMYSRMYFDRKD